MQPQIVGRHGPCIYPEEYLKTGRGFSMPKALCKIDFPQYRGLFPDWSGPRPWRFFLMEQLLEARKESMFPTNGAGFDEDVNVYLSNLLAGFLNGHHDARVQWGADPVLLPPAKNLARRVRADWYRINADHRLLYLGLMDRGDGLRRRPVHLEMNLEETRNRDLVIGRTCYGLAANLLTGRSCANAPLAPILRKLEENFEDYVHVLGVLATRRLGLGALLSDNDLAGLLALAS
jgi:hypothetical protein